MNNNYNNQYLIFLLANNLYGLPITNVTEILEYQELTKVPTLPEYIHGLLNLRGIILPIIDLNLYLGQENINISNKTSILVINYNFNDQIINLGILVDEVKEVATITADLLANAPHFNAKIKPDFIANMVLLNEKITILLNLDQVFSEKELNIIADISK